MSDILPTIFPLTLLQGGDRPDNVFSHLGGHGSLILAFLTYRDANALRATCKEACSAVAEHKWMDSETRIKGSLKLWRTCFRNAKAANIFNRRHLKDIDFVHFKGIHTLNMTGCTGITDAAFVHLKEIHTLTIDSCFAINELGILSSLITNDAFVHLTQLRTLNMIGCDKITDNVFVHLKELHNLTLFISNPDQFTGEGFVHLKELRSLNIDSHVPSKITDTAFVPLKHLEILELDNCPKINGSGFVHLNNIKRITCMDECEEKNEALQAIADAMVDLHAHARANAIEPVAHEAMVAVA
jgi:hypothetical protein